MVDMKKAIAKCSHEDAPELSLPPYRSAYRFTNTMINKGNEYEHINDMASMFAKMKNKMKNDDYSSSSYNSDNAFDMFSDMFDQQSNYKSSSDYNNQMGRMSQFKNMFNSMRFKRAAGDN